MELKNFQDDLLDRKTIAINLSYILKNFPDLNVLAIDSSWGTGKTTFINMWIDMLKTENEITTMLCNDNMDYDSVSIPYNSIFETVYFNAWECDYMNDPLISLLSTLEDNLESFKGNFEKLTIKSLNTIRKYGKATLTAVIKVLTSNLVNLDSVTLNDNLEEELPNIASKLSDIALSDIAAKKEVRSLIKEAFTSYRNKINENSSICKKIIIFIDELDRCRPTFAIELLETIKHFFNLDDYIFVISLDKEQLSHSIKTVYGENMDSTGYLRRFFDLEYTLPFEGIDSYIDIKFKELDETFINTIYIKNFLKQIFLKENYSLRDIDKSLPLIKILLSNIRFSTSNPTDTDYSDVYLITASYLYSFLINLKIKYPLLLKKIITFNYTNSKTDLLKFITFDLDLFNLEVGAFADSVAKEILYPVIEKFLEFNLESQNLNENDFNTLNLKEYNVGILNEPNRLFYNNIINISYFFRNEPILKNIQFTENFNM